MADFDVLDFLSGRSLPTDTVTVYTDATSGYYLNRLEEKIASTKDAAQIEELEAEKVVLTDKIKASAITLHLQGLSDEESDEVQKSVDAKFGQGAEDTDERILFGNSAFLGAHLTKIVRADGSEDTRTWDTDSAIVLYKSIPEGQRGKVNNALGKLSFEVERFKYLDVTPDFS